MSTTLSPAMRRGSASLGWRLVARSLRTIGDRRFRVGASRPRPQASALAGGGRRRAAGRFRSGRGCAARFFAGGCGAARAESSTLRIAWPTLDLVAGFDLDVLDLAGDRRRHFDGGFVGFELENRLILRDRVAGLDQDAQHVAAVMFSPSSGSVKSITTRNLSVGGHEGKSYDTAGFASPD